MQKFEFMLRKWKIYVNKRTRKYLKKSKLFKLRFKVYKEHTREYFLDRVQWKIRN